MNIVILGAGQVGGTLAEHLAKESNNITVVDNNQPVLQALQERLDLGTVVGNAVHPNVLKTAGCQDADLLIAVTNSDETNMLACQIAYTLFRTPTKIARVRSAQFLQHEELFSEEGIPVDVLISPEQLITDSVKSLLEYPGSLQVLDFAQGRVKLVGLRVHATSPMAGCAISKLEENIPDAQARVAAIYRQNRPIIPKGSTIIEANDEVFFIAARENIHTVMSELQKLENPYSRIIIAGGGNIGVRLAKALEMHLNVKLIEINSNRASLIANELDRTLVLHGDASDRELLLNENIEETDVFCAVTNDDEANIMTSMLAKRLGARKVLSLISRASYIDIVQGGEIDIALSPQQATISGLLQHIRRGDIVQAHSLRRGAAEVIETIAHGDNENSRVVGKKIAQITLPPSATIGAIVRETKVLMPDHELVIESEDHVILFVTDKNDIHKIEELFQVGFTFF
jgi:trk system potassium uptake protein TrkA